MAGIASYYKRLNAPPPLFFNSGQGNLLLPALYLAAATMADVAMVVLD
jgi:hypothetical protein